MVLEELLESECLIGTRVLCDARSPCCEDLLDRPGLPDLDISLSLRPVLNSVEDDI